MVKTVIDIKPRPTPARDRDALVQSGRLTVEIRFTERELLFIKLRFEDVLSYKEIAEAMQCSKRTVNCYAQSIYKRLGLPDVECGENKNTIRATKLFIKHGII